MHVYNQIEMVRDLLARKSTAGTAPARTGFLDDTEILRFLNSEQKKLATKIQAFRMAWLEPSINITTDANGQYTLPTYVRSKPIHIYRTDQSAGKIRITEIYPAEAWFYRADVFVAGREKWYYQDKKIHFVPSPGAVTNGWNMTYRWKIPDLHTGTAAAGAATTLTLADSVWVDRRDDYYNDVDMHIVSGTAAGEYATITDYAGSTRIATVDFSTTPDTTSIYAMESPIPEDYHVILVLGAAILGRLKARERAADLKDQYNEALSDMIVDIETGEEIYPRHTEDDYDSIMMED